jgi:predicted HicB family RNase H-like nuclease
MAKKIGRPTKPPEDSLSEIVPIRLTPGEREQCEMAAERAGRKLTAWIREQVTMAARRQARAS